MEKWKPITGYEEFYEVSNYGNVRSLDRYVTKSNGVIQRRTGRLKAQTYDSDGYKNVKLCKDGRERRYKTHVLVAKEFVQGYFDGAEVNHLDFNRENNNCDNLEWVTHKENVAHTIYHGRHVSNRNLLGTNNPNFGNHKLFKIYELDKNLAKEKQSRPGVLNGRATPIRAIIDGEKYDFDYIGECAKYLIDNGKTGSKSVNSVSSYISKALKSGNTYCGNKFSLLKN